MGWDEVPGVEGYIISFQTESGEFILPETDLGILTSFSLPEALPYATSILVAVTPYNSEGGAVACTFSLFRTQADPETVLPDCTEINLPLPGATNVTINTLIRWNTVSNVDGHVLNIGTTEGGTEILDNFDVGLGASYEPEQNLTFDQEVFVIVVPYLGTLRAENCTSQSFVTVAE